MSATADCINVKNHSLSPQQNMIQDDVPTLQNPHEHHPDHMHHDSHAEKGRKDEVTYTYGTTFRESNFPHQDPQDHDHHRMRHTDIAKEPPAAVDPEQGTMSPSHSEQDPQSHASATFYKRYRIFFHLLYWTVFTGWWIAGLILHGIHDPLSSNTGWLKPFLLWLGITLRIVFFHVPVTLFTKPIRWAWKAASVRFAELLPDRVKIPLAALLAVSVFFIGAFISPESEDNTRDNRAVCTYISESTFPLLNLVSSPERYFMKIHSPDVFQVSV